MNSFIDILKNKMIDNINALSDKMPIVTLQKEKDLSIISNISSSVVIEFSVSGDTQARVMIALPMDLLIHLSTLIFKQKINDIKEVNDDVLVSVRDLFLNIFNSIGESLLFQANMPRLFFNIENVLLIDKSISLESFNKMFTFSFSIDDVKSSFIFIVDDTMADLLCETKKQDLKFPLRIRFGTKDIFLEDFLKMDDGTVVKLDQPINDLVDVLLDDAVIAHGKIVVFNGKFGIKIIKIKSKKEILNRIGIRE